MLKPSSYEGYPVPARRPRTSLVVLLFFWSIFHFLAGAALIFVSYGLYDLLDHTTSYALVLLHLVTFACVGLLLLPWSWITFVVACRVLGGDSDALERALVLNKVTEFAFWIMYLGFMVIWLVTNPPAFLMLMFLFPIPVAVTITGRRLSRAVNPYY